MSEIDNCAIESVVRDAVRSHDALASDETVVSYLAAITAEWCNEGALPDALTALLVPLLEAYVDSSIAVELADSVGARLVAEGRVAPPPAPRRLPSPPPRVTPQNIVAPDAVVFDPALYANDEEDEDVDIDVDHECDNGDEKEETDGNDSNHEAQNKLIHSFDATEQQDDLDDLDDFGQFCYFLRC